MCLRDPAVGHAVFRFAAENRRGLPDSRKLYPRQLSHCDDHECRAFGARQQSSARIWHRDDRRCTDGALGLAYLPVTAAWQRIDRIHRYVSASGASSGVRIWPDVGLGDFPDPDLWHTVVIIDRLSHGISTARCTHDRWRYAADRQEFGRMRADVRRVMDVPDADRDDPPAQTWAGRRLGASVHRQRARARRLDLADGSALESDYTVNRRILV